MGIYCFSFAYFLNGNFLFIYFLVCIVWNEKNMYVRENEKNPIKGKFGASFYERFIIWFVNKWHFKSYSLVYSYIFHRR